MISEGKQILRLQLLSYLQTPDVLSLLRVGQYEISCGSGFKASVFLGHKARTISSLSIDELESKLKGQMLNAVKIVTAGRERGKFRMMLWISPNNSLWADTRRQSARSPRQELVRRDFESIQIRVARLGIRRYPTLLDCYTLLQPTSDLGESARRWILETLRFAQFDLEIIGSADLLRGATGEAWSSFANELDRASCGTDRNQGRFDTLHDFMICPPTLGDCLQALLGSEARTWRAAGGTSAVSVVELPFDPGWRENATRRVHHLLASRPAEQSASGQKSREYQIYSRREYKELDARGMVPRLVWDEVLHPALNPDDGRIVGIETDEMIVLPIHRATAAAMEREAVQSVQETGAATPEEILRCYEHAYRRFLSTDYLRAIFERLRIARDRDHPTSQRPESS